MAIRVYLIDPYKSIKPGVKMLIDMKKDIDMVGDSVNTKKFINSIKSTSPDIIIIHCPIPNYNDLISIEKIHQKEPFAKIIIISAVNKDNFTPKLLKAGASGFILKKSAFTNLVPAIYATSLDRSYIKDS